MSSRERALELCILVAKNNNLKCVPSRKLKFAALTAIALVAGVVVGGPRGLAVGAAAAAVGTAMLGGRGRNLELVLEDELTQMQKEKLGDAVLAAVRAEGGGGAADLVERAAGDERLEAVVVQEMKRFFKVLDMCVTY